MTVTDVAVTVTDLARQVAQIVGAGQAVLCDSCAVSSSLADLIGQAVRSAEAPKTPKTPKTPV